jgi:hypothetical protein
MRAQISAVSIAISNFATEYCNDRPKLGWESNSDGIYHSRKPAWLVDIYLTVLVEKFGLGKGG